MGQQEPAGEPFRSPSLAGRIARRGQALLLRVVRGARARLDAARAKALQSVLKFRPLWDWAARTYEAHPTSGWQRALQACVHEPLWRLAYRWIYHQDVRASVFAFVCAYWYRYPIAEGHVIVQIGASEGEETVRLADRVGRRGLVIAIEPDPKNFEGLVRRTASLANVRAIHSGAYSRAGEVEFLRGGPKAHRIGEIARDVRYLDWDGNEVDINRDYYEESIRIPVDTLDGILAAHDLAPERIDFLLIETNGSELEVLRGLSDELLARVRCVMARAHVQLDGVVIHEPMTRWLESRGFETWLNREEDVAARRSPTAA